MFAGLIKLSESGAWTRVEVAKWDCARDGFHFIQIGGSFEGALPAIEIFA